MDQKIMFFILIVIGIVFILLLFSWAKVNGSVQQEHLKPLPQPPRQSVAPETPVVEGTTKLPDYDTESDVEEGGTEIVDNHSKHSIVGYKQPVKLKNVNTISSLFDPVEKRELYSLPVERPSIVTAPLNDAS